MEYNYYRRTNKMLKFITWLKNHSFITGLCLGAVLASTGAFILAVIF